MARIWLYLPYMFTLHGVDGMPNTNNRLEGVFTDIKRNIDNSGMTHKKQDTLHQWFILGIEYQPAIKKEDYLCPIFCVLRRGSIPCMLTPHQGHDENHVEFHASR